MTYKEVIEHINSVKRYGNRPGVECTKALLAKLGNPEAGLKFIHVAGTNGKGSVCTYISNMLIKCGKNVGTFTSPHLVKENERIRINGEDISDDDFTECFMKVHEAEVKLLEEGFGQISYFDFFVGVAILYFQKNAVDFVVLETGLGGRLDSTNAINKPIACVITSISLDHTAILGETVEEIAKEKAGIIKEDAPLVYICDEKYSHVLEQMVANKKNVAYGVKKTQCNIVCQDGKHIDFSLDNKYYKGNVFRLETIAKYQVQNASLALMAMQCIKPYLGDLKEEQWLEALKKGLSSTRWEGRMQQIFPDFYLDGAHNPDGIKQFLDSVGELKKNEAHDFGLIFSAVRDKNFDAMVKEICESGLFEHYIVTQINGERKLSMDILKEDFIKFTNATVRTSSTVKDAVEQAINLRKDRKITWFLAGSLYLVGEAMTLEEMYDRF